MKQRMRHAVVLLGMGFLSCSNPSSPAPPSQTSSGAGDVASAKSSLAIGYQALDHAGSVTLNLTLPLTTGNSVTVSWGTSTPSTISTTGSVTRPAIGLSDAQVTLTATLTKGPATDTKDFLLTVMALPPPFSVVHDWTSFGAVTNPVVYSVVQNGSSFYIGTQGSGLLFSDDSGATWSSKTVANSGLAADQIYSIAMSGSRVLMATFGGLSVWDRSTTPGTVTNYLSGTTITDLRIDSGNLYLAAHDGIHYGSLSNLSGLTQIVTSFPYPNSLFIDGGKLYAAGSSNSANPEELNVFVLGNLSLPPTKIDVEPGYSSFVGPISVSGSTIVVADNFLYYRSVDGGAHFSYSTATGGGTVTGLASDGSWLYMVKDGSNLWYSSDLGANWKSVVVPGHGGSSGLVAKGIMVSGTKLSIALDNGVVIGSLH